VIPSLPSRSTAAAKKKNSAGIPLAIFLLLYYTKGVFICKTEVTYHCHKTISWKGVPMDHNKRAALLTAIDVGNLTRAAEQLGYTQSGLSYIIKSLQNECGFRLLIRSRSG
jgi:hypothetical protein